MPYLCAAVISGIYVELLTSSRLLNASALLRFLPANAAPKNMTMFWTARLGLLVGMPAALRGPWVLDVGCSPDVFAR